jgi:hypothetical protein
MNSRRDRRRHRVYVTQNTEYHFRDDRCVAVRDRRGERWQLLHLALARQLTGSVRFGSNGDAYPSLDEPAVGDALFFGEDGPDVVTSVVAAIDRPAKDVVLAYPA